jgi:tRNA (Guanine-1)-methyltransferase
VEESFSQGLLEYPQYTRPAVYRGMGVPEVLTSGDHGAVARWRHAEALRRTLRRRPDLLEARQLAPDERRVLDAERLAAAEAPPRDHGESPGDDAGPSVDEWAGRRAGVDPGRSGVDRS